MNRTGQQFASDNYAGICPEAWAAMERANRGHAPAYGEDAWTRRACDRFREIFETDCSVYFVFNGTAANSLALAASCQSYHSVLCHALAHVETDECGAAEFFSNGSKILLLEGEHGKITPAAIRAAASARTDIHFPRPRAISLTQATELGTVYGPGEIDAIGEVARELGLHVHMDGARFANAVASLGVSPADLTWRRGIDVLSFGGIKNGLSAGEAVVFFDPDLAHEFDYRCKQAGQLASKMRFTAAAWCGLLEGDTWLRNARHANAQAAKLAEGLRTRFGIVPTQPRQANAVFISIPDRVSSGLAARGWRFYDFIGSGGHRLMCAWDLSDETIENFLEDFAEVRQATGTEVARPAPH